MRFSIREFLLGPPIETARRLEHRLPNLLALPVFASDALSSVAYGTQEILIALSFAGALALGLVLPVSIAIAVLMFIVALSYRQAIHYYPSGGGSYSVAKDNLGIFPGLTAAAALAIDYILTVAVSISSGVENLASAYPILQPLRVEICIALVALITLANLRGVRESGFLFAIPTYSFITFIGLSVITSIYHIATGTIPPVRHYPIEAAGVLSLFLILRAFSNGCSAMTGVEAVSNGVTAFRPPEVKNASKTLVLMVSILVFLFLGTSVSAYFYGVVPHGYDTITSQIARANFGSGLLYQFTQIATLAILVVAANTSYADFPRLSAMVARDGYAPKMLSNLGDRLVHNQGIFVLAVISSLLIIHFKAVTNNLIPLYAVGVFLCFTLSQVGMVRKHKTLGEKNWLRNSVINALGASITAVVTLVIVTSKFTEGAWMVVILIPILVLLFNLVRRHYDWFDRVMTLKSTDKNPLCQLEPPLTILVLVSSDIHRGIIEGIETGRLLAEGRKDVDLRAVHIEMDPEKTQRLRKRWTQFVEPYNCANIRLDIVPSPYRRLIEPLMDYLDKVDAERENDRIVIVLPEFETGSLLTQLLHNFTGRRLRNALLNRRNVLVVYDRFFMR